MTTSGGIPVAHPMDMKGDLTNNWKFFKESWTYYEIAPELEMEYGKIRVATLLAIIRKKTLQIYHHLPMT